MSRQIILLGEVGTPIEQVFGMDDAKEIARVMKGKGKIEKVMKEFKEGKLHSGSKKGPVVIKASQAKAIALDEARRGGKK